MDTISKNRLIMLIACLLIAMAIAGVFAIFWDPPNHYQAFGWMRLASGVVLIVLVMGRSLKAHLLSRTGFFAIGVGSILDGFANLNYMRDRFAPWTEILTMAGVLASLALARQYYTPRARAPADQINRKS